MGMIGELKKSDGGSSGDDVRGGRLTCPKASFVLCALCFVFGKMLVRGKRKLLFVW